MLLSCSALTGMHTCRHNKFACGMLLPQLPAGPMLQDMTTLSYLNEPGVLWNLKCRYMLDAIYTYTGSILIAVNPFARLPQHVRRRT